MGINRSLKKILEILLTIAIVIGGFAVMVYGLLLIFQAYCIDEDSL